MPQAGSAAGWLAVDSAALRLAVGSMAVAAGSMAVAADAGNFFVRCHNGLASDRRPFLLMKPNTERKEEKKAIRGACKRG
jgi:hypothetical protein